MKKLTIPAAALATALAGAAMAQDVVRLGTEGAYPPWNFINDAGEVDGFERELGDELCKRAELTCTWVTNDWDSIIPNLVSGNYDAIMAGMSVTDERDAVIDFTQAYTPADPSKYISLSEDMDVETAVVAAQTNTIQAAFVADQGWTLVEFPTPEETIQAVRDGEADVVLADGSYLDAAAAENDDLYLLERIEKIGGGVAVGLRESDGDLRAALDAAIQSMKDDGTLNAMIEKWEVATLW